MKEDDLDRIMAQWRKERPDLNPAPMGVIGRVFQLSKLLEQRLEKVFKKHKLATWAFDVLVALRRAGPPYRQSPTALFSSLLLSSGAMTNRIDRLEQSGLVTRVPDPQDRRGVLVQLTPKGIKLVDSIMPEHLLNEEDMLRGLSAAERKQIGELLRKLILSL
ncbi:MAG TPA: MarR family transcriptional regulator [Planctomycetota bacterium]|nr:MarR family transcriptional regulator [Planctomycetota bacterium]